MLWCIAAVLQQRARCEISNVVLGSYRRLIIKRSFEELESFGSIFSFHPLVKTLAAPCVVSGLNFWCNINESSVIQPSVNRLLTGFWQFSARASLSNFITEPLWCS